MQTGKTGEQGYGLYAFKFHRGSMQTHTLHPGRAVPVRFKFHRGSMQTLLRIANRHLRCWFKFHRGSMQTKVIVPDKPYPHHVQIPPWFDANQVTECKCSSLCFGSNSTVVRCKPKALRSARGRRCSSNSTVVRCKPPQNYFLQTAPTGSNSTVVRCKQCRSE